MLGQLAKSPIDLEDSGEAIETSYDAEHALAAINEAVTSAQVARVLVEGGVASAGALSGALAVFNEDRRELRVLYSVGETGAVQTERRLGLNAAFPLVEAVRSHQELWLAHPEELAERFPEATPHPGSTSWVVLPLMIDGIILGAVGWSFREPGFSAKQCTCLHTLARAGGGALYRAGLFDSERRARMGAELDRYEAVRRDQTMAEVSATLDSAVNAANATTLLTRISSMILPAMGTWCAIYVLDRRGYLEQVASAHVDPAKQQLLQAVDRRHATRGHKLSLGITSGHPLVLDRLEDRLAHRAGLPRPTMRALRAMCMHRLLVMPMRVHGHTLGTLCVASDDSTGTYTAADLSLANRIARRCAASLEYARLHDSAERANQAHDDFVAATSHELRTPLSHIKGFVSTLRTTDAEWDATTRADFLAEIEHEADRLARLVETMLDMSRIDSGCLDPADRSAVAPAALVHAGIDRIGGSVGEHPLELQVPEDLPPVLVDASQVERVIANLLDNAGKYSPAREPIAIIAALADGRVIFRVEDRGLGIPTEHLERIFEPFFREPKGGYPAKPGSGLGLAICRSIVRSQSGRIWAEQRPGGGAALVFTLPLARN